VNISPLKQGIDLAGLRAGEQRAGVQHDAAVEHGGDLVISRGSAGGCESHADDGHRRLWRQRPSYGHVGDCRRSGPSPETALERCHFRDFEEAGTL
jgi:hypothetical protein